MSLAGIVACRSDESVAATRSAVAPPAGKRGLRDGGPPVRGAAPRRGPGGGLSRSVLLLLLLCVCVAAASPRINCRVHVFHSHCRGVAARSLPDGSSQSPLKGHRLRTLLHRYITADDRRTKTLESLGEYLKEERPVVPEQRRNDESLLRRLLRTVRDSEESDTLWD